MTVRQSDPAEQIRQLLKPQVTPDVDQHVSELILVEYGCAQCQERCINPERSVLAEVGVCLDCHAEYAAHGHVRGRISSRWD